MNIPARYVYTVQLFWISQQLTNIAIMWNTVIKCNLNVYRICKGKGKIHPRTGHEGPEGEQRYSFTLSLTSVLDRGGWSMPRPSGSTPSRGKTRYGRLGGPQSQSGQMQKILPPPGFDPRIVQPVASRYTNWAILAPNTESVFK